MSTDTSIIIGTDQAIAEATVKSWNEAKAAVQAILDLYDQTGLSSLTAKDFSRLFNDTESLFFDKITGGKLVIDGTEIDRTHAIKMVAKPTGYEEIVKAIATLKVKAAEGWGHFQSGVARMHLNSISAAFRLDDEGVLKFSAITEGVMLRAGAHYLHTEKGKAVYEFLSAVNKAYSQNNLNGFGFSSPDKIARIIEECVRSIDLEREWFNINYDGIKDYDK